jgi:hypothetical protein
MRGGWRLGTRARSVAYQQGFVSPMNSGARWWTILFRITFARSAVAGGEVARKSRGSKQNDKEADRRQFSSAFVLRALIMPLTVATEGRDVADDAA